MTSTPFDGQNGQQEIRPPEQHEVSPEKNEPVRTPDAVPPEYAQDPYYQYYRSYQEYCRKYYEQYYSQYAQPAQQPAPQQPVTPPQYAQPYAPQYAPPQYAPQQPAHDAPQPAPPQYTYTAPTPSNPRKTTDYEKFIGKNLFGIAASVLIFIGLIFFGVLIYENINDAIKVTLMYAVSLIITGLGLFLFRKKNNVFTKSLIGCGVGCVFISILTTHVHFKMFDDITAFSLLLVWLVGVLFLSKKLNSLILNIIAHIGMIISICFAYSLGLSDDRLAMLLIYQFTSVLTVVLGNMLFFKKMFRFGLFVSMGLTIIATLFMIGRFCPPLWSISVPFDTNLPTFVVLIAFVLQFVCVSFLSHVLSVSTGNLKNKDVKAGIHVANKLMWTISFALTALYAVHRIVSFQTSYAVHDSALITALICLGVLLIHGVITVLMSLKLNFDPLLETISITMLSVNATIVLLVLWLQKFIIPAGMPNIPWFILIAGALLALKRLTKNKAYTMAANILLGLDLLFMLANGYGELQRSGTLALPLGYMLLYPALLLAQWVFQNDETKRRFLPALKILSFLSVEFSVISIFTMANIADNFKIMWLTLTVLVFVLSLVKYDSTPLTAAVLKANAAALLLIDAGMIAFSRQETFSSSLLLILLSCFAFALIFIRVNRVLDKSNSTADGLYFGIGLSVLALATIHGNTNLFDQTYLLSLICMLSALVCVIIGLFGRNKALRLYGLSLTMACVLKLMTFDVAGLETLFRVLSLIGGGVICFAISAIYNYTVKHLSTDNDRTA